MATAYTELDLKPLADDSRRVLAQNYPDSRYLKARGCIGTCRGISSGVRAADKTLWRWCDLADYLPVLSAVTLRQDRYAGFCEQL